MAKRLKINLLNNQSGFTLVEVMIALTLFAVFTTVFIMSQATNQNNSSVMSEDIKLHNLAEMKINEILLDPPEFTNATDNTKESKAFDIEGYKIYKYTIEYKKLEIPNLNELSGKEEDDDPSGESRNNAIQKMVFQKLKENMEKILWQVKVTVENTETQYAYELTSWISNPEAKIDTNFGF